MTTETNHAEEQAKAQLRSINNMMARLEHIQYCNGDDCELTAAEIAEGLDYWKAEYEWDLQPNDRERYHDEDSARDAIMEDPLSVEVRSGWANIGDELTPEEYCILLCTGGPAVRIIGSLDQFNEPNDARLEYQDWFTPWFEYITTGNDHDNLMAYAQQFLFSC